MNKTKYIIILFILIRFGIHAQTVSLNLLKSNLLSYHNHFFVYGFKPELSNAQTFFKCYKYDSSFILQDSVEVLVSFTPTFKYLEIEADTLHGSLNFFFQKFEEADVKVLRLSSQLQTLSVSDKVNSNHMKAVKLNALHVYYDSTNLYTITKYSDSISSQFYLNKYKLLCDDKHYEYQILWQYPIERQNIKDILIQYSNSNSVILYALVIDGLKKGEWILQIDSHRGELIKGTRLNLKGENKFYFPPLCMFHDKTQSLVLIGNTTTSSILNFKTNEILSKSHLNNFYVIELDSMLDISNRTEKLIPIPQALNVFAKTNSILFNPIEIKKISDSKYALLSHVYSSQAQSANYITSWLMELVYQEEEYIIEPLPFYSINLDAKSKLISNEKIEFNTADHYYLFFKEKQKLPLLVHRFENGKPIYVFLKNDINGNMINYYKSSLGLKAIETSLIDKVNKEFLPKYFFTRHSIFFKRNSEQDKAIIEIRK